MFVKIQHIRSRNSIFPPLLYEVHQPPKQLYIRGNTELLKHPQLLAVVGSRRCSVYGKQALIKLLTPIVQAGIPLVSGMAYGIDSLAHKLCVDNNRPTIAVLGSGIDDKSIYPQRHISLAHKIIDAGGAVISEYEPGTPAYLGHFPARNRIIAGLSQALIVIQAAGQSGSLITARLALENGKEVCAVPGAINDPLATGTNHLIQHGATPILDPQDILDLYGIKPASTQAKSKGLTLSIEQQTVIQELSTTPQHIDDLALNTKSSPASLSASLVELELLDLVQNVGGMRYVRK